MFIVWRRKTYGAFEIIGGEEAEAAGKKEREIYLDIIILLLKSFKLGSDRLTSIF